jgi:hypothetical protein
MIHGLTPAFTECGKIKLGGLGEERLSRQGKAWRAPVKYDAFVVTKTYRNAAGDLEVDTTLMEELERDSDGKLRAIPIVLHSDDIDEVFPTAYARYAGKKLHCSGDGKNAVRWELKKSSNGSMVRTGESKQVPCPCDFLTDEKRSCKPHAILYCSIRIPGLAVAGAIHTLRTTSIITIQRVMGSLLQIKKAVGMIQGLPLWLVVQPVPTENGTVYCAHVELRAADIMDAQKTAIDSARMRASLLGEVGELNRSYRAMLKAPASIDESQEEQRHVADEYCPEDPDTADETTAERPKEGRTSYRKKKEPPEPVDEETMPPHDLETGEVIEQQSEDLARVLAGIANSETWDELFLMAKEVNKLKGPEKDTAKEAYSKRKAEIETEREPGAEG